VARVGRSAEAEDLRAGDAISLTVSPDEVLLFDAVDGQRLRP